MTSRVFVPQVPSRFDKGTRLWVPSVDISSAELYGDITVMFPPDAHSNRLAMEEIVAALSKILHDFKRTDFLLCCGAPALSHAAAILASRAAQGRIRILEWDRFARSYHPIEINT
jgi:hypothetical protein